MTRHQPTQTGIGKLINKYTARFRIRENLEHYSKEDFIEAEKRFVRHCLRQGGLFYKQESLHDK